MKELDRIFKYKTSQFSYYYYKTLFFEKHNLYCSLHLKAVSHTYNLFLSIIVVNNTT